MLSFYTFRHITPAALQWHSAPWAPVARPGKSTWLRSLVEPDIKETTAHPPETRPSSKPCVTKLACSMVEIISHSTRCYPQGEPRCCFSRGSELPLPTWGATNIRGATIRPPVRSPPYNQCVKLSFLGMLKPFCCVDKVF